MAEMTNEQLADALYNGQVTSANIQEAIARLRAPAALPEGWKAVPVEASEKMLTAFNEAWNSVKSNGGAWAKQANQSAYRAMLNAAPAPSGVSAPAAGVPGPWLDFMEALSKADGGMVNGNKLAARAKELLASAPQATISMSAYDLLFAHAESLAARLLVLESADAPAANALTSEQKIAAEDRQTDAEMARIGYQLMEEVARNRLDFDWNRSGAEIVSALLKDICAAAPNAQPGELPDVLAKIDKAQQTVSDLCHGRIKWTMRVPAEPDRDPDLIIAGALHAARAALAHAQSDSAGDAPEIPEAVIEAQAGLHHPVTKVFFRAGLIACREYMARFVEAESPSIAASIRANWWPTLGEDFGPPRKLDWAELTEGEYGTPSFREKTAEEVPITLEALPIALKFFEECAAIAASAAKGGAA